MCFAPVFPTAEEITDFDYCSAALSKLKGITFCCLNIRSLTKHYDSIKTLLNRTKVDCLILNETFLNDSINDYELEIPDYDLYRFDRNANSGKFGGGGVAIYAHNKYDFTCIEASKSCTPHSENFWLQLSLPNTRPTLINAFYRPPDGNVNNFLNSLREQLSVYVQNPASDILMFGDANIDLEKANHNQKLLKNFLIENNLEQLITRPTRVTNSTSSLLDHIYVNNPDQYSHRGVLEPGLSDHSLIFTCRKRKKISKTKKTIFIRNYRKFSQDIFCSDIKSADWTPVFTSNNVDDAVTNFNFIFTNILNKNLPLKKIRVRESTVPWITNEYYSLIDLKEYKSKQYKKCPCPLHLNEKKDAQRQLQRMKNQLKRNYIETVLDKYKHNSKKLWQNIREFWPSSKNKKSIIKCINGKSADLDKANELNNHFANIGNAINNQLHNTENIEDFLPNFHPPIFDLHLVTEIDLIAAIDRLSSSASCSFDGITSYIVKSGKSELLPVLLYIFNLSIKTKTFPELWKPAKVTPLFKAGDPSDANNYRPISILPTLGKVLERLVHNQLYEYLTANNLLNSCQSGFRKGHSTGTCLIDFLHNIYGEIDEGGACGVLFLDLSKAFDTVDHDIIKIKLKSLGLKEAAITWFSSYLKGRTQQTQVGNSLSSPMHTSSGVPQGSILGPLLFVCYVNDLPKFCKNLQPFMYADDTALLVKGKNIMEIQNQLQYDFNQILRWLSANRLSLNAKKTKSMLLCHSRSPLANTTLHINCGETIIEPVRTMKYLGIHLDNHLSFNEHIENTIKKVNQRTRIMWKVRNFIDLNLATYLYKTLIHPLYTYCDFVYDGCNASNKLKLEISQNAALRAVNKSPYDYPIARLHDDLEIDNLTTSRQKSTLKIVYRALSNTGPERLNNMFTVYEPNRQLRSANEKLILPPKTRTKFAENDIAYRGCTYWNPMPLEGKYIETLDQFKKYLKPYGPKCLN